MVWLDSVIKYANLRGQQLRFSFDHINNTISNAVIITVSFKGHQRCCCVPADNPKSEQIVKTTIDSLYNEGMINKW